MSDPEPSNTDATSPDPRLLEELDEHIREARTAAEDAVGFEGGPSFVDSGTMARENDGHADDDKADDGPTDEGPTDDEVEADDGATDDEVEDRADTDNADDDQTIAPPG